MAVTVTKTEDGRFIFSGRSASITKDKNAALAEYGRIVHGWGIMLRLLPDEAQADAIRRQIGNARFVRNRYLEARIGQYSTEKTILSVAEFKKHMLPQLKEEFPFLRCSDKFALESGLEHVDAAFKKFYSREASFPKFASKHKPSGNRYTTKATNGNIRLEARPDGCMCLRLPKVGMVRAVIPKGRTAGSIVPPGARILSCSVKADALGFTASLQLEEVIRKPERPAQVSVRDMLAADMGLKSFMTVAGSDGAQAVDNPRWIRLHARRLRRFQKALSRKQYDYNTHAGSKNWEKARARVAKEQRKCADQRKDFRHKLSRAIADSCDAFVCEDLNIRGMVRNRHLAREVSSVGWGGFLTMVRYKMEARGGYFLKADRFFPSSQLCSHCGYQNPDVKDLSVRQWTCPQCGAVHDRDANAGKNLLAHGIQMLKASGIQLAA